MIDEEAEQQKVNTAAALADIHRTMNDEQELTVNPGAGDNPIEVEDKPQDLDEPDNRHV